MNYAIKVDRLKKSYGKVQALRGVSFNVKKGEFFGFLGPNGAGKSTTINILIGLLAKDSGEIEILGKELSEAKQEMNLANAYSNLSGILSVEENLKVFAKLYKVKNAKKKIKQFDTKIIAKQWKEYYEGMV